VDYREFKVGLHKDYGTKLSAVSNQLSAVRRTGFAMSNLAVFVLQKRRLLIADR
jgi:hypothetical protein